MEHAGASVRTGSNQTGRKNRRGSRDLIQLAAKAPSPERMFSTWYAEHEIDLMPCVQDTREGIREHGVFYAPTVKQGRPGPDGPTPNPDHVAALAMCARCPLTVRCLADAMSDYDTAQWGVRGGKTQEEKRALWREAHPLDENEESA